MRVLLTGGCGFIGSHLTDIFVDRGDDLLVIDNHTSAGPPYHHKEVRYLIGDILSDKAQKAVLTFKPSVIIHLAAQMDVRFSVEHPEFDARVNVEGTLRMLEAGRLCGAKRFIFASSGGAIYGEAPPLPAGEDHAIEPISAYGTSKYASELYLGYYQRLYGMNTLALRLANVYGPRQSSRGEAGVVAIFCSRLIEKRAPAIFGDGEQTRDYIFVDDVCKAFIKAIMHNKVISAVNIGTGKETSVNELYEQIKKHFKLGIRPEYKPERPGELKRSALSGNLASKVLGFNPKASLAAGLKKTVNWAKENYSAYLKPRK